MNILTILLVLLLNTQYEIYACNIGFTNSSGICDECGLTYQSQNQARIGKRFNNTKIVGGSVAVSNSWPAQASIFVNGQFSCGGTLINRYTVLTAAHCIPSLNPTDYEVYLGVQDIRSLAQSDGVYKPEISKIIVHPLYDRRTLLNDIAMIKLRNSVPLNNKIQIACLPLSMNYPSSNVASWTVGWGATVSNGDGSDLLKNVKITVYDGSVCNKYSNTDWNKQICSGEINGGKDSCQGDSGGPLYVLDKIGGKNKYVLAGVVSYGDECAKAGYPGIYTRVSAYLNWINSPESAINTSNNLKTNFSYVMILILSINLLRFL